MAQWKYQPLIGLIYYYHNRHHHYHRRHHHHHHHHHLHHHHHHCYCPRYHLSLLDYCRIFCNLFRWHNAFLPILYTSCYVLSNCTAGPSSRAVWDGGLRPLAFWDSRFELSRKHGPLSLVNVVCCQVEVSVSGWLLSRGVLLRVRGWCVWAWSGSLDNERPLHTRGCCAMRGKY
jgi:hypothetical protein